MSVILVPIIRNICDAMEWRLLSREGFKNRHTYGKSISAILSSGQDKPAEPSRCRKDLCATLIFTKPGVRAMLNDNTITKLHEMKLGVILRRSYASKQHSPDEYRTYRPRQYS